MHEIEDGTERALLVEVDTGDYDADASLAELYELARSAGAEPFGAITQKRPAQDKATCVGSGMMQEIADFCEKHEIDLLIFDCELSPTQIRNIETISKVRVVDRTMLILDIFASRARSKEGKLQVELAQLKYMMPRLSGKGTALSRLGGGIGTRGPGESKLETDRRHIRRRIDTLNEQLADVEKHRGLMNRRRKKDGVITVALVGYTNAGKSTLMNCLTQAGVLAENMLFATLDPTARALKLPCGTTVMLIDTVGLIRRLPHHLVQAFRSTLEQAADADIILNVCDASSPEAQVHLKVTTELLAELGCEGRPIIPVFNKCDLLTGASIIPFMGNSVRISAADGTGINKLLAAIEENLPVKTKRVKLLLPFMQSGLAAQIRRDGTVENEEYTETGLLLTAQVPRTMDDLLKEYEIE
ncbi:GTPase HflX [Caproiciproducens galactitolivorans]|uniref:GTPase HflX n=1 Tax=Caproiciproducens galactitolivorans TaxID=642589 RepID=A0ABT4BW19_9FIRM|nr:GTPase HflX [Caproiciproducens galactitolivorans]MCY1715098.1 GTPase HflX [Caproiciproducens galactitolivorans]